MEIARDGIAFGATDRFIYNRQYDDTAYWQASQRFGIAGALKLNT